MSDAQYKGTVEKIFPSRYGGGSFSMNEHRGLYFNTKQPLPAFVREGTGVSLTGELGRNGKSVFVREGSVEQIASAPAAQSSGGGSGGGTDWAKKDASIQYQSSRKDAIEMVKLLITTEALVLPASASKKAGVIEAAVDRFTAIYFEDVGILGALDRATVEEPKPAKAAKAKPVEVDEDEDEELPE